MIPLSFRRPSQQSTQSRHPNPPQPSLSRNGFPNMNFDSPFMSGNPGCSHHHRFEPVRRDINLAGNDRVVNLTSDTFELTTTTITRAEATNFWTLSASARSPVLRRLWDVSLWWSVLTPTTNRLFRNGFSIDCIRETCTLKFLYSKCAVVALDSLGIYGRREECWFSQTTYRFYSTFKMIWKTVDQTFKSDLLWNLKWE